MALRTLVATVLINSKGKDIYCPANALDGDPAKRFSGFMRILRENTIADYDEDKPPV